MSAANNMIQTAFLEITLQTVQTENAKRTPVHLQAWIISKEIKEDPLENERAQKSKFYPSFCFICSGQVL